MTREEAIRLIGWLKCTTNREDDLEAINMAIEALSVAELKSNFESAVPNCQRCAIKELWKETEKEDLVEVVRCKDCDNFDYAFNYCNFLDAGVEGEDFFCAYGERREE